MLLAWHGFHDSVKEGDRDRILLYWKVMLPVFQKLEHYNYAKEAFYYWHSLTFYQIEN